MVKVLIEGLPAWFTEEHVQALFERSGPVEGAEVAYGHTGESLRFGYVTLWSEADAIRARQTLNLTSFDGNPIVVILLGPALPTWADEPTFARC